MINPMKKWGFLYNKKGALPAQTILAMMEAGFIKGADPSNVRPASLDLSLSDEAYEVEGIFQPRPEETVRAVLSQIKKKPFSFSKPLWPGKVYVVKLREMLTLPETVYGYCNPKSTSGRLDVHVRLMADGVARYDSLNPARYAGGGAARVGWHGELWVSIMPKSFAVLAAPGQSLNQLRFFNLDTRLSDLELELALERYRLLWRPDGTPLHYRELKIRDNDSSLILTLGVNEGPVGWVAIPTSEPVELSKINTHDRRRFFKPVKKIGDHVHLKKNEFYILSTNEAVRVPPELACEMAPMDERSGEFRSHYAGFIDPGWGWGEKGEGRGRPLTLEVRPFEDLVVRHNQPIAKIRFERMAELPNSVYDSVSSNYIHQLGPKLSKHFK